MNFSTARVFRTVLSIALGFAVWLGFIRSLKYVELPIIKDLFFWLSPLTYFGWILFVLLSIFFYRMLSKYIL